MPWKSIGVAIAAIVASLIVLGRVSGIVVDWAWFSTMPAKTSRTIQSIRIMGFGGHCATEKGIIPSEASWSGTDLTIQ